MAFSYSALTNLLAEDGRDDLIDQIDNETVIVDWKMPEGGRKNPQKVFEKLLRPEEVGRVQVDTSGMTNVTFQSDGGVRGSAVQLTYASGNYGFCILTGDLEFPIGILGTARGGNGIDLYKSAVAKSGKQLARTSERAIIDSALALTENSESIGTNVVVEIDDISGFRTGGGLVDIYATNGTTIRQLNAVTGALVDDGDGTGSIVLVNLTSNLIAGDVIHLAAAAGGASPAGSVRNVNIRDICNSSVALYSNLAATDQPSGVLDSTTTAWGNAAGKRMIQRIRAASSSSPDVLLVHPYQAQKVYESQNPNLRFSPGDTMDVYRPNLTFDSCKVIESNSAKPKSAMFLNTQEHITKLHCFWEPGPQVDGGKNGSWSRESLQLSQVNFSYKLFLSMGFNLRVPRRNAHGMFTALNAAF